MRLGSCRRVGALPPPALNMDSPNSTFLGCCPSSLSIAAFSYVLPSVRPLTPLFNSLDTCT